MSVVRLFSMSDNFKKLTKKKVIYCSSAIAGNIMYAIDCNLEQGLSVTCNSETYQKASEEIMKILIDYGFTSRQGSTFLGNDDVDAVSAYRCLIALNELTKKHLCLGEVIKNTRILEVGKV